VKNLSTVEFAGQVEQRHDHPTMSPAYHTERSNFKKRSEERKKQMALEISSLAQPGLVCMYIRSATPYIDEQMKKAQGMPTMTSRHRKQSNQNVNIISQT